MKNPGRSGDRSGISLSVSRSSSHTIAWHASGVRTFLANPVWRPLLANPVWRPFLANLSDEAVPAENLVT